jgi:hypothetical protein
MLNRRLILAFLLLPFGVVDTCYALCVDDRHPSVSQEFTTSTYVIIGMQVHERSVGSNDDPKGVVATIYSVRPIEVFKGGAGHDIPIWSENTSARFVMEKGKKYLLFVTTSDDGLYIDNCGNSGPIDNKDTVKALRDVRSLTSSKNN